MITSITKMFEKGILTYCVIFCEPSASGEWKFHKTFASLEEHLAIDEAMLLSSYDNYADYMKDKAH